MTQTKQVVTSGIPEVDHLLGGGIIIGDNVIWYDDAGLLARVFCQHLLAASVAANQALIYISFDYSPKSLLEKLGPLADSPLLTVLDCFTHGKGESAPTFLDFYHQPRSFRTACRLVCLESPRDADQVAKTFYALQHDLAGDVRFIFESLTGMQELWGEEEAILKFYASACPRLYELNTIAYWIAEKGAHSERLKAHFNKITQVAVDLSLKRGKTYFTVLKAEKRNLELVNQPTIYWHQDQHIILAPDKAHTGRIDLGVQLKTLRKQRGLSQKDLARQVGVTPSNISQVENNQVYPSLPALMKMAEIFSVNISYFFQDETRPSDPVVFSPSEAQSLAGQPFSIRYFPGGGQDARLTPCLVEIPAQTTVTGHFFQHKGEEMGYLISGRLTLTVDGHEQEIETGEMAYLTRQTPTQWKNNHLQPACLLWIRAG